MKEKARKQLQRHLKKAGKNDKMGRKRKEIRKGVGT